MVRNCIQAWRRGAHRRTLLCPSQATATVAQEKNARTAQTEASTGTATATRHSTPVTPTNKRPLDEVDPSGSPEKRRDGDGILYTEAEFYAYYNQDLAAVKWNEAERADDADVIEEPPTA